MYEEDVAALEAEGGEEVDLNRKLVLLANASTRSLCISSAEEALTMLLDSVRVREDLTYALESLENGVEWTLQLIVREFRFCGFFVFLLFVLFMPVLFVEGAFPVNGNGEASFGTARSTPWASTSSPSSSRSCRRRLSWSG